MSRLINRAGIVRFFRYSTIGVSTFLLDLALLFILTDVVGVHYVLAAGVSFAIAISINYMLSRQHVFAESTRTMHAAYGIFLVIGATGLLLVMGLMCLTVDVFGFNYIASRIVIAGVVGIWSYLMHLYLTFKLGRRA